MLFYLFVGVCAFVLFFVYDLNACLWRSVWGQKCFFGGIVLLAASTIGLVVDAAAEGLWHPLALLAAALCLAALVYTLFFALPFGDTYQGGTDKPQLCQTGVYALCRHPGVWCFAGFYGGLWLAFGGKWLLAAGLLYNGLNVLYVVFQDRWSFVRTFEQYRAYQAQTPFLLPSRQSIRRALPAIQKK